MSNRILMRRILVRSAISVATATGLVLIPAGLAHAVVALAGPGAYAATYATPVVVTAEGAPITFINGDIAEHTVTASEDYLAKSAAKKAPWCKEFTAKKCPLFHAKASTGMSAAVQGTDLLQQGEQYPFVCLLHPNMTGTIIVAPGYQRPVR